MSLRNPSIATLIIGLIIASGYIGYCLNTQTNSSIDLSQINEQLDILSSHQQEQRALLIGLNNQLSIYEYEITTLNTRLDEAIEQNRYLDDVVETLQHQISEQDTSKIIQFEDMYNNVFNSVVSLQVESWPVTGTITPNTPLWVAQGSGFVYSKEGLILTNHHVIERHRPNLAIYVKFQDGSITMGTIVASDPVFDVAILRTQLPANVEPLPLGNSSNLGVGQRIGIIGNPLGYGGSLTIGVVSQLKRDVQTSVSTHIPGMIQVDASINPGNSGGPVINERGEVVGVVTLKEIGYSVEGMGFAIPSNLVTKIVTSLLENNEYKHPYLGVYVCTLSPRIQQYMRLPSTKGVLIVDVEEGGPAERAGLRGGTTPIRFLLENTKIGGDVIISVDGREVIDIDDLAYYLINKNPGEVVSLTVIRNTEEMVIELTLGEYNPK